MKRLLCVVLITLFATLIMVKLSSAANILTNASFEDGDFPPADWADWSGSESQKPDDGVAGFPVPKELSRSGNKAVGKILYGTGKRWGGFSQTVGVSYTRMFSASGWVMNRASDVALGRGTKVFIEVKFLGENEEEIRKTSSSRFTRPAGWTKLNVKGIIPQKAKKAVFSFVVIGEKGSTGKVIFDDAELNL